jgi:Zn-dependent protease/predicted transcriptional regulator
MPSSFRFGKYFDVEVRVHITFILFVLFWGYQAYSDTPLPSARWPAAVNTMGSVCALFVCVVLHEYGHILMARKFGIRTRDILLLPIGGVARLERIPERNREEILVALAGPAVNVVIAIALYALLTLSGVDVWQWNGSLSRSGFFIQLLAGNVVMIIFNMIPAFPMDGGRVLRALLGMAIGRVSATVWATRVGRALAVGLAVWGLNSGHYILVLSALMVWIGAGYEAADVVRSAQLQQHPAQQAALSRFVTLNAEDTLLDAIKISADCQQADFPVVEGDIVVGALPFSTWSAAARDGSQHALPISSIMLPSWVVITPGMTLGTVETLLQANQTTLACQFENGKLVGIITPEIIRRFLALRASGVPVLAA